VHDSLPGLLAETRFELGGWRRCSARTGPSTRRSPAPSGPRSPRRRRTPSSGTCSACRRSAPPSSPARWHSPPASTREDDPRSLLAPLENAEAAWSYLLDTPESYFRHDDGQSSGSTSYRKPGNLGDGGDRFWAAAELLKTTGESQYADYLEREHADQFSARPWPVEWYRTFPLGQWAYYTADAAAPDRRSSVGDAFREYADNEVQQIRRDGYNVALTEGQYYWGRRGSPSPRRSSFSWRTPSRPTRGVRRGGPRPGPLRPRSDADDQILRHRRRQEPAGAPARPPPAPVPTRTFPATSSAVPTRDGGDPVLDEYIESQQPPPAKAYLDDQGPSPRTR